MPKMSLLFVAAVLTALGASVWEGDPHPAIFPEQRIPIFFSHDYHTQKPVDGGRTGEGLECTFCHESVSDSKQSSDRDIPGHGACDSCHAEWIGDANAPAPITECVRCHKDLAAVGTSTGASGIDIPTPNIKFGHADHLAAGIACVDCHSRVPSKTLATRDDYPTMDRCIACHKEKGVSTECRTCHLTLPSGRLQTEYAGGLKLMPTRLHSFAIHDADFLRDHSVPAKREKAFCKNCHGEDDCMRCHDGVARDVRYHPGDWISTHPVRAKKDDYRCQSCHRLQTFCFECHVRSGVATVSTLSAIERPTLRRDPQTQLANGPHPMRANGWIDPRSRNFHGFFAQRNIRTCVSCHQEQDCIACHSSAFGEGGNPHGPHPERLKGSALRKHNARMCLKCHNPTDPSWR